MRRVGITLSPRARRNVGIAALVLTAIGLPEWLVIGTWTERATLRRQWTVSGSACPIVDKPDRAVVGRRSPQYFTYEGVRFGRQFGEVSCAAPPTGNPLSPQSYAVCQFPIPAMVSVETERGKVIFQPGVGRRVTVTVRDGKASCVMGGWFRG